MQECLLLCWLKKLIKIVMAIVEAFGEGEYMEHIENIDVILVGPQIRHLIPSIKNATQNKIPVSYINPMDYGMMRVDNVIAQIKKILEG